MEPTDPLTVQPDVYDIFIVGAGTAGCVLANRLAEDPNLTVLLLGAGENKNEDARVKIPALSGLLMEDPEFDWKYPSEPQADLHDRSIHHPCGTCSMMREDPGGVVNSRLRVYGTRNVRVVDASVVPIIPRGNIITSVYALAEKAADMIKEDLATR